MSRKKVTVTAAWAAKPRAPPVSPSSPLGTSTATSRVAAANVAATTPPTSRDRPAPNTASITNAERAAARGPNSVIGPDPATSRSRGVGAHAGRGQCSDGDGPAGGLQEAGRHIAVTAIVARAAQDERPARTKARGDGTRHGAAGIGHQGRAGHAETCGKRIGMRHLLRREKLDAATRAAS